VKIGTPVHGVPKNCIKITKFFVDKITI